MTRARIARIIFCFGLLFLLPGCYGLSGGVATGGNRQLLQEQDVQDPALRRVAAMVDEGDGEEAFDRLVERFEKEPQAAYPDVALWLAANALIENGQRIKGFYYLDQLLDEHSGSPLYYPAALKQYEIADSYLRNRSDRAFFFPVRMHDEAIEMLFRVQQRLPGSPLAEQALKRTADFYFSQGDYDFAEDAYGVFIDRFPRSEQIPTVRLKQAYSNVLQYNGPRYDPTTLLDASAQLRQFSAEFPEIARQQNIPGLLQWIDEQLAEKLMITADFYRRTGDPEAGRLLLARVTQEYPDTAQAEDARRDLERNAAPTTRPAAEGQP